MLAGFLPIEVHAYLKWTQRVQYIILVKKDDKKDCMFLAFGLELKKVPAWHDSVDICFAVF